MFEASHDNGSVWGPAIDVSRGVGLSSSEGLSVSQGAVYIVWQSSISGHSQVRLAVSENDGLSFSNQINLSNDAGQAVQPAIATLSSQNESSVFVTWEDNSTGSNEIMITSSSNEGSTWATAMTISDGTGSSTNPSIAAGFNGIADSVYVIWTYSSQHTSTVMESTSANGGTSFMGVNAISTLGGNVTGPRIASREGSSNIYIAWIGAPANGKATNAYLSTSSNGGLSWGSAVNLSNDGKATQVRLNDQAESTWTIFIAWVDLSVGKGSIFCSAV